MTKRGKDVADVGEGSIENHKSMEKHGSRGGDGGLIGKRKRIHDQHGLWTAAFMFHGPVKLSTKGALWGLRGGEEDLPKDLSPAGGPWKGL